jgi:anti-sigma factor RsiW
MDCCEFRERYSDFADGLLDQEAALRARRHLGLCAACRRFDAAFQTGVNALRDLPSVEVSRSFGDTLRGRIRHELAVRTLAVSPLSGAVAALLVLVAVGLVSWDLAELRGPAPRQTAAAPQPPVVRVPAPVRIHLDTLQIFADGFHPFDPVLLVTDTMPASFPDPLRVDVPAVWGGR